MHAVIAKTNPRAPQFLATLDSGLGKMEDSGECFRIVSRNMAQYRSRTQ